MSGRGRRRRRRRGGGGGGGEPRQGQRRQPEQQQQGQPKARTGEAPRRSRSRRRGRRGRARDQASPTSSEDLVRALPRERPETLTLPPDGTSLEQVIGELQSEYGVPQYPQEYRITLKVAEERDGRVERTVSADEAIAGAAEEAQAPAVPGAPRREKAPSLRATGGTPEAAAGGRRRRRGGRRRRRGRGGSSQGPSGPEPGPS